MRKKTLTEEMLSKLKIFLTNLLVIDMFIICHAVAKVLYQNLQIENSARVTALAMLPTTNYASPQVTRVYNN